MKKPTTFAQRLTQAIGKNLQQDIAAKAGVSPSRLSSLRRGGDNLEPIIMQQANKVFRLAEATGTDPYFLCPLIDWDAYRIYKEEES